MAEWVEPCEWGARSNKVLRENLIAKTTREASHADSQKVCRVTGLRMLCVREKQTRARRVDQTGKEHTLGSISASHVCGDCEVCCWGAVRVMCVQAMGKGHVREDGGGVFRGCCVSRPCGHSRSTCFSFFSMEHLELKR